MSAVLRLPATLAFQHADFRRLQGARVSQNLAMQMDSVAVGWQIYDLTHSALHLGYVGLVQFLPSIVLALITGHVADRFNRRTVLMAVITGQLLCTALLVTNALTQPRVGVIYLAALMLGTCRAFNGPAMQALMPRLVPLEHFANAVSWHLITFQLGMAVGPAVGGFIYGGGGPAAVFLTGGGCFATAGLFIWAIKTRVPGTASQGPKLETLLAGVRYVWQRKNILGAISLDLFAVLLGGAVALLPIFARDILHTGPWGLGLLRAAPAVGAGLAALFLAAHPLQHNLGRKMFLGVFAFGLSTMAFGLSTHVGLSIVALFFVGASDMVSLTVRQMLIQLSTPDAMRGRVGAVTAVFVGASNELGEFESGVTAAWLGAARAVVVGGVGTCVVGVLWMRWFRGLWQVDTIHPVQS